MGVLGDKLVQAIDDNKNDVYSYIWKGPKKYVNGIRVQDEFKLMDASEAQIKKWYEQSKSMLYSTDKDHPGRYILIDMIKDQRMRCNAQLYIKYLRDKGTPAFEFRQSISAFLNKPETLKVIPRSKWKETTINSVVQVPDEFKNLTIDIVLDACLDALGYFDRSHITINFLTKFGLWFTNEEKKTYLNECDSNGKPIDKLELVKRNLNLRNDIHLHTDYKGGLSYLEFRAMCKLKKTRYSDMTEEQLRTLRDKVLFRLEDDCHKHIEFWSDMINKIEKVCEARGIELK